VRDAAGTELFNRQARVRRQGDGGPRAAGRRLAPALVPHDTQRSSWTSCPSCPQDPVTFGATGWGGLGQPRAWWRLWDSAAVRGGGRT
jgi:hypothetical protein